MSLRDLELTLDKQSFEYPALVREAIIKKNWHATAHQTEIVTSCASLNEKYCWFQSRNEIYIWERNKTPHRGTIQLPLPTSGLPRSAKCAVVYDNPHNGSNARFPTPGVLTVSPEGILRHWISTESQNYVEKQLDIDSEVAMAVELGDAPDDDKSASFFLYTTSGSIFLLIGEGADAWKTGALQCYKLFGRRDQGFKKRLSSLFSKQTDEGLTSVLNTFKYVTEDGTLIISIAPNSLSVFHVDNQSPLWTLKLEDFFQPKIAGCFKEDLQREANLVRAKLIDVAVFRGGLLVLVGGVHEESTRIHLFALWLGPEWIFQTPEKTRFHAKIQITEHKSLFMKKNDQIYSNLSLCIPKMTSEATSAERTDGILIIHPLFAMTLYFPFNLEKPEPNDTLVRYASYPKKEQLIGYAICEQYVYVMMLDTGIYTLRLLPSGFADGTDIYKNVQVAVPSLAAGSEDWPMLSELLTEMVASGLPKTPVFQSLHRSFEFFAEKEMGKAADELKDIVRMADQELTRTVAQFLFAVIDYSDAANKINTELHAKKVLTSRFILFLNHMNLRERVSNSMCPLNRGGLMVNRTGNVMLGEVTERVAMASAILTWRMTDESYARLFDSIIEQVIRLPEVQELGLKDKDALFGRCSLLHHIPALAAQHLDQRVLTKSKTQRMEVFHAVCELLAGIREVINTWRLCRTKIALPKQGTWWTIETFADSFRLVAERTIEELKSGAGSESERTRLMLYLLSIYDFYLDETDGRPDNDKVLLELIGMGKAADAMELAEKHRDFGILIKNYLNTDKRQATFDRFKKAFVREDFEMYLCEYLRKNGLNEVLLEQTGKRVDTYLDGYKELRYSREISLGHYGKAAYTLMSLAESETKSFRKFADFLTRAYNCASICRDGTDVSGVIDFYKRRYPEMKHRMRIPQEVLHAGYGNVTDVMMSVEEMLEWNMAHQPNDTATVQGFVRAFHLLADLSEVHPDSGPLAEKIQKTWKAIVNYEEWDRVRTKEDVETKTILGKFCDFLANSFPADKGDVFPAWLASSRLQILPLNMEELLSEIGSDTPTNCKSWIKGHVKWAKEELTAKSRLSKEALFRPDTRDVGSFAQAALTGFGPILELRAKRFDEAELKQKESVH
uniref:Nucleoporin n=1 Tax=Caenorhabditis tropicalis TaxID=1561998 RepID=A0A1I7TWV6_9PELO